MMRRLVVAVSFLLATAGVAFAQAPAPDAPAAEAAPELAQRYEGAGWSIGYPAGWLGLGEMPPLLGTDPAMVPAAQRGTDLPAGGISVGLLPPPVLAAFGMPVGSTPEEALRNIADGFNNSRQSAVELVGWPFPAWSLNLNDASPVDGDLTAVAALTPAGVILSLLVHSADGIVALTPLLQAMLTSYMQTGL